MDVVTILTFLGGIIGGGGLVKSWSYWLEHTRNNKTDNKDTFNIIIDRLNQEIADLRALITEQRAYIQTIEEDNRKIKANNSELQAQVKVLNVRANLYEMQSKENKVKLDESLAELERVKQSINK